MNNQYIRTSDLKCPSTDLKCALADMLHAQTTIEGSFDAGTNTLTLVLNGKSIKIVLS